MTFPLLRFALCVLVCAGLQPIFAADYYLSSSTGSDRNSGLDASAPWASLAKLRGGVTFLPGDRILLKSGDIFSGNLFFDAGNVPSAPSAASPLVVTTYGGTDNATVQSQFNTGCYVYDLAGLEISNLVFEGSGQDPSGNFTNGEWGILFYTDLNAGARLDHVRITNVQVRGYGKRGIAFDTNQTLYGYNDVQVVRCEVSGCQLSGFETSGPIARNNRDVFYPHANVVVSECLVEGITGDPNEYGTHTGDGILLSNVEVGTITNCLARNNGARNVAVGGPVGIWVANSRYMGIQFCESYGNRTNSTANGGGFDLDGATSYSVIQYCYSHANDGAGYLIGFFVNSGPTFNNAVRYNVSQNDGRKNRFGGIYLYGDVNNTYAYNNTVIRRLAEQNHPAGRSWL